MKRYSFLFILIVIGLSISATHIQCSRSADESPVFAKEPWDAFPSYKPGDSIIFYAGSWKKGVVKEVGVKNDLSQKNAVPFEYKYLIAPDAYANYPDWTDFSLVTKRERKPFWTNWFAGDWQLGEVMAVNTKTEGAYERTEFSYAAASEALRVDPNGSYKWKTSDKKTITGKWIADPEGPGIILQNGYKGLNWTLRNQTNAVTMHIRKLETARLFPPTNSVMSISAKRKL